MLDDADGLFWTDEARVLRGQGPTKTPEAIARRMAALEFDTRSYVQPELRDAPEGLLAYDLETYDPTINTKGPAWAFPGIGKIIGVAVAWEGFDAYYPIGHREGNVDQNQVFNWIRHYWNSPKHKIVCANAAYDLGWTYRDITGHYPRGGVCDIQHMAAMLDEYRASYGLDAISISLLGKGKNDDVIETIMRELNYTKSQVMGALKELPGPVIAPYASTDTRRTFDVHAPMYEKIVQEGLTAVYELESGLIPLSTDMRRKGVRVDVDKTAAISEDIELNRMPELQAELKRISGVDVEPWEVESCAEALMTEGVKINLSPTGGYSIDAPFLEKIAYVGTRFNDDKSDEYQDVRHLSTAQNIAHLILRTRKMDRANNTFLKKHILYHANEGRVHPELNQLKSERDAAQGGAGFGTVTARYSITGPALQQIPVRDPEWGPLIRSCFLPELDEWLTSLDYSSQEPRLAVHFAAKAKIKGGWDAVMRYRDNPNLDYHQYVADLCGIKRSPAKNLNLGLAYGMGGAKMARALNLPTVWKWIKKDRYGSQKWVDVEEWEVAQLKNNGETVIELAGPEAKAIIAKWEKGAPFIRGIADEVKEVGEERGFILTLLRRRCRFIYNEMTGEYEGSHKALNKLCQSSAADQTKTAMLHLWNMGITPMLSIHDELLFSLHDKRQADEIVPVMRDAITLLVPTVVEPKFARDWGGIPK